jgi:hypothetical protein
MVSHHSSSALACNRQPSLPEAAGSRGPVGLAVDLVFQSQWVTEESSMTVAWRLQMECPEVNQPYTKQHGQREANRCQRTRSYWSCDPKYTPSPTGANSEPTVVEEVRRWSQNACKGQAAHDALSPIAAGERQSHPELLVHMPWW